MPLAMDQCSARYQVLWQPPHTYCGLGGGELRVSRLEADSGINRTYVHTIILEAALA